MNVGAIYGGPASESRLNGASARDLGIVVTRTPLRLSFAGGGTDLPDFYEQEEGAVLSTAIDKYIYVTVKRHGSGMFDEAVRVNYSKSERVESVAQVENNIARECLRFLQVEPPIYVSTVGDMPASSGLGGSSAFTVGLLNALHLLRGERVTAGQLAEEASYVEMEVLHEPIGKQDQYAAAFGGLNLFRFQPGGRVTVVPQHLSRLAMTELFESIMLFWTGHQRDTSSVLGEQKAHTDERRTQLEQMRDAAYELEALLATERPVTRIVGRTLHETWLLKRGLASTVTNSQIDSWYERAMNAGAEGGKVAGAGGGGFLFFIVRPDRQQAVRAALSELREVRVAPDPYGSRVLLPFQD
jgi:D-glycero-alpha-D-manno-heptose-7-phosphate kinase